MPVRYASGPLLTVQTDANPFDGDRHAAAAAARRADAIPGRRRRTCSAG